MTSDSARGIVLATSDEQSFCSTGITPNAVTLSLYSASLWIGHRIHYDTEYCRNQESLSAPVIHGPLQASYIVQALELWVGRSWSIQTMAYRHHSPALLGDELHVDGLATRRDDAAGILEVEGRCLVADRVTTVARFGLRRL